jgi:hypothetical protein
MAESTDGDPNGRDDRQEQVVETLVECELLGGKRLLLADTERPAGTRRGPGPDSMTKMYTCSSAASPAKTKPA